MGAALPLLADTGRSRQIVGGLRDDGSAIPGNGSHSRPPRRPVSRELLVPEGVVSWKTWPGAPVSRLAVGVPADCSWTTLEVQAVPS